LLILPLPLERIIVKKNNFYYLDIILLCFVPPFIFYSIFYYWPAFKEPAINFDPELYTSFQREWIGKDDARESYIMFIGIHLITLITLFIVLTWRKISAKNNWLGFFIFYISFFFAYNYVAAVGYFPPMNAESQSYNFLIVFSGLMFLGLTLWVFDVINPKLVTITIAILLTFFCFISTEKIALSDYSFIWAPAYRIIKGYTVSEIYFLYDLFLSLLAAAWMKTNIDLGYFQLIGQISFYVFFLLIFFFSRGFFQEKRIYILFFLCIIFTKYANTDPVAYIQVTPWRLDLWIILLLIAHYKSIYHWSMGIASGLLVVLHGSFGIIYLGCYLEVIVVLFVADYLDQLKDNNKRWELLKAIGLKHLRLSYPVLLTVVAFFIIRLFLFEEFLPSNAKFYQELGISMLPISKNTIYWYMPIIFSGTFLLLWFSRSKLKTGYFTSACFILFLAIGNSMYFFGRSHENNLINISTLLFLVVFTFFDLVLTKLKWLRGDELQQYLLTNVMQLGSRIMGLAVYVVISLTFLALSYSYSDQMISQLSIRYRRIVNLNFFDPPIEPFFRKHVEALKTSTKGSQKVYFFDMSYGFLYTYTGGYEPIGYFFPTNTWIFNKDMFEYMQKLLDTQYYVVIDSETLLRNPGLGNLKYTSRVQVENFTIIKNN
ncbi:MAG TPA: hypothetical protein VIT44_09730, partial [Cyclobacteriaceae bacterium]